MLESEFVSSGEHKRIVVVVVGVAVAAPVEDHCVVEEGAFVFRSVLESLEEVSKLLGAKAVPFSEGFGSAGFVPPVSEAVLAFSKAKKRGELGGDGGGAIHVSHLVG